MSYASRDVSGQCFCVESRPSVAQFGRGPASRCPLALLCGLRTCPGLVVGLKGLLVMSLGLVFGLEVLVVMLGVLMGLTGLVSELEGLILGLGGLLVMIQGLSGLVFGLEGLLVGLEVLVMMLLSPGLEVLIGLTGLVLEWAGLLGGSVEGVWLGYLWWGLLQEVGCVLS